MAEPVRVLDEVVQAIHKQQLAEHGGAAGVRDHGLLASALARPRHLFAYGESEVKLARLAVAYAFGIARNHPFVDGNKRTAFVVALLFLRLNGFPLDASQEEKYDTFVSLAAGRLDETELGNWLDCRMRSSASAG